MPGMFTRRENVERVARLRAGASKAREDAREAPNAGEADWLYEQAAEAESMADEIQAGIDALDRAENAPQDY